VGDSWEPMLWMAAAAHNDRAFFDVDGPHAAAPGHRGLVAAILAAQERSGSWTQQWREGVDVDTLPRWPSTLEVVDRTYGGFFGLTALVSEPGCGKTMLALSSALQAAATGKWNVKFFGAEVDDDEIISRRNRELRVHEGAVDGVDFFEFIHVGRGQSVQDLVLDMAEIDPALPILVVQDSINTMATLAGGRYLDVLNELCLWAAFARKLSRGAISFLIVSETNKRGKSKGEKLEFWSDLCINMSGKPDETAVDFRI